VLSVCIWRRLTDGAYVIELEGSVEGMGLNWLRMCGTSKLKSFYQSVYSGNTVAERALLSSGRATAARKVL